MVIIIIVARYLGENGFGKYSFVFAFTTLFSIISDMGLSSLAIREISRHKDIANKYLTNFIFAKGILSAFTFIFIYIAMNSLKYPNDTMHAVYIAGAYVITDSFTQFLISFFRAFEKMVYETIIRTIEKVIILILIIGFIYSGFGLIEIVSAFLISSIVTLILCFYIVYKRFARPNLSLDSKFIIRHIKEALPFGMTFIFVAIYFKIDTIMLSSMKGDSVVGLYNAAYNILLGTDSLIAASIAGVCFPIMSRYFYDSNPNLKKIYLQSFQVLFFSGIFIAIIITIFANQIINITYGSAYAESTQALQILIWAFFLVCISTISSTLLYSVNKTKIVAISTGFGVLLNITLNLILIPHYSLIGASYATVATELFGFLIYFYFSIKLLSLDCSISTLLTTPFKDNIKAISSVIRTISNPNWHPLRHEK